MSNSLIALSNELAAVVEQASRYVAGVHGHPRIPSSGIVWKPGVIIAAEHTLRRDDTVRVTLPDGRSTTATVAGRDAGTDLAVLKFGDSGGPSAEIDEAVPKTGDLALAVGRTRNAGVSAVLGIISGVGGEWNTWRGGRLDRFVRLDLRLYPGLSGGAIVNAAGKLTGMATAGLSRSSPLSVPISTIHRITKDLIEKGHVARGYLGIGLQPVALPEHLRKALGLSQDRGLIVLSVEQDAAGARAGLVMGDILVALNGKPVIDTDDIQALLAGDSMGRTLKASIVRAGAAQEAAIVVGEKPRAGLR